MSLTKAVILAAGEGSRLGPLTANRPKVMLPIANKPILEHLLLEIIQAGIHDFYFVVGYHDEQIREYFRDGSDWGINIQYFNQRKQSGTADALRMVAGHFTGNFLVANGDVIIHHQDIQAMIMKNGNSMSVIELPDVACLGVIEGDKGQVFRVHEKLSNPPSHLANAGLYLFTQDIFSAIEKTGKSIRGEFELTDSIQILINEGKPVSYQVISQWPDLCYPWDLLAVNEKILSAMEPRCAGTIEDRVTIKGAVSIGKGTTVRSGSYIVGPVIIGQNCDIGPNCFIRPSTAIGNGCHIGAASEVKNSIIMNWAKVPHLNYVGDSIIGENCNLGAGTKIANLKLDKGNIIVDGVDTNRRKLGAIIGDNVQTGINASINVGALIGNNSFIGPGAVVSGIVAPGSRIF